MALVKREKMPQVLLCSLLLSGAFYTYIPGLVTVLLSIFLPLAVYGGLLGYRTAKDVLGLGQQAGKNSRPWRLKDYSMIIITIVLIVSASVVQSIYAASTQPNVHLSSFSQARPSVVMRSSNSYRVSFSNTGNGSFSFKAAFSGSYYLDFSIHDANGPTPNTILVRYSIDGNAASNDTVTVSLATDGITSPIAMEANQTLIANYTTVAGPLSPYNVEISGQVCWGRETLSFSLKNTGNAKASLEVEVLMDSKPSPNFDLQIPWNDIFTPLPAQTNPDVFWYSITPGSSTNVTQTIGIADCGTHQFNETIVQQLKS